jgi:hypothetical protein
MSIIKRAGDLVYTLRFLRLLTTAFKDTEAYKLGIIDVKGKRDKSVKIRTDKQRSAYTGFHRLVFNIKKIIEKAPGGRTKLASYAAALYLMKEQFSITNKQILEAVKLANLTKSDFLNEHTQWFMLEDGRLSPGIYKILNSKVLNSTMQEMVNPRDKISIDSNCYPVGSMLGIDIYEATHVNTNQKIYVSVGELSR